MPAFAVSDANDENMTFAFVGDVMMGRTFPSTQLPPQDGAQLFTDAKPILKRVDMALGNLEGALCEGGTSTKGTGPNSYAFRTPPRYAKWLKDAGFDFMSMANNHSRDFGQTGIEQTEQALREQGIAFAHYRRKESSVIRQPERRQAAMLPRRRWGREKSSAEKAVMGVKSSSKSRLFIRKAGL